MRNWLSYVKEHEVVAEDLFILRSHMEAFAVEYLYEPSDLPAEQITTIKIDRIRTPDGNTAGELIEISPTLTFCVTHKLLCMVALREQS